MGVSIAQGRNFAVPSALIILDGLADRPKVAPNGATPLESARTPNLDRLASSGALGEVIVIGPSIAPESDAGVLALLGYDPIRDSPGRGVLEAWGVEAPLVAGDIALRLNFASGDGEGRILDSRVGRALTTKEASALALGLTGANLLGPEGIRAEVRATVGHRGILWLHPVEGGPLSPAISNPDPFYEKVGGMGTSRSGLESPTVRPCTPTDTSAEAARTARAVDLFLTRARGILAGHSINARRAMSGKKLANELLVRGAGTLPPTPPPPFSEKYGAAGAAITEMPVERGIAHLLGLEDLYVGPLAPDAEAGYRSRALSTRQALERFPFVYVHLKGPDEPGHDGDSEAKRVVIESIDRWFFGPFLEGLDLSKVRIAITADHATPCVLRGHSADPVPLLLAGVRIRREGDKEASPAKFGESEAARGELGRKTGKDVLGLLSVPRPTVAP